MPVCSASPTIMSGSRQLQATSSPIASNASPTANIQRGDRAMRKLERQDILSICDQLDALGWLNKTPGLRPTDPPRWDVNPICHAMFEQRANTEAEHRRRDRETILEMVKGEAGGNQDDQG